MKKILGLDLGTNSIGWSVVRCEEKNINGQLVEKPCAIEAAGSRIIPMDAATLGDFNKGNSISQTKERTGFRGTRRLRERELLRRSRLHRVLSILNFLPDHYKLDLDRYGNIKKDVEPKLAWRKSAEGKYEFIFQESFRAMLAEFERVNPGLLQGGRLIPYDWTIYYLRKKALRESVSKYELAWILLNFNQKRGYYQLRGEDDEEDTSKTVEYKVLKVVSVMPAEKSNTNGKDNWYAIKLENGDTYFRKSELMPDWEGLMKEFIVTTELTPEGTPKHDSEGNVKRSYRMPKEDDWTLLKKKTEHDIEISGKTVGEYIFDSLLTSPEAKIRGELVRTIERKFYKKELQQILTTQATLIPELVDMELLKQCAEELYPQNEAHRRIVLSQDFASLFINDIIFFQRPLKSKKSLIAECQYETHKYLDKETGEEKTTYLKCISKSHPLFQEFRLWQFINNLKIYQRISVVNGKTIQDIDVTADFFPNEKAYTDLYDWMSSKKTIDQKSIMSYLNVKKPRGSEEFPYRWNYVEDKEYPGNETNANFLNFFKKGELSASQSDKCDKESLWHILYSIEDKEELSKALASFAVKNDLPSSFVEAFSKFPPFEKEYASYSAKAIKKLLPLMRYGKYWNESSIDKSVKSRINDIIKGEIDDWLKEKIKMCRLSDISDFKALPLWLACYVVYGRYSENMGVGKWNSPHDIDVFLNNFKQYSLRNPIVEQVVTESLRTVRDIWTKSGQIDEIHIELGREIKNPADKRKQIADKAHQNEERNIRIKTLLSEFMNPEFNIENVRPYSPSQQTILAIYEDYALHSKERYDETANRFVPDEGVPEDILKVLKKFSGAAPNNVPTKNEILRYKLWLEQRYRSPYTGKMIPLAKLFTTEYEIEHVIPQARYFDNSFNNKVICESAVNKLKDNSLGMEFINAHGGEIVELGFGTTATILSTSEYEALVRQNYSSNKAKMEILLSEDIPEKFISRQMNDSRYISRYVMSLLSNVVRERLPDGKYEPETVSKNIIPVVGQITDILKKDWGVNDVWNSILLPRFERMNSVMNRNDFTGKNTEGHLIPIIPDEFSRSFNKKRLDHRHHAMDAIVIACATRDHVNLINNSLSREELKAERYDLQHKLRRFETVTVEKNGEKRTKSIAKEFLLPWDGFMTDVHNTLSRIIVSFKQNNRTLNQTCNYYSHYVDGKKVLLKQAGNDNFAVRKALHKDTVFAAVNLQMTKTVSLKEALQQPGRIVEKEFRKFVIGLLAKGYNTKQIKELLQEGDNKEIWGEINPSKILIYCYSKECGINYYATRKPIDGTFTEKKIKESVTDTAAQKILLAHLSDYGGNAESAFSPEGLEAMNKNIITLNSGHQHKPLYKVRVYENANKYAIGSTGNKKTKFVEAAKGTNLYYAVYQVKKTDEKTGEERVLRSCETIPLRIVIERQKQKLLPVPETDANSNPLLFFLTPGDLVYVPDGKMDFEDINASNIYKFISCSEGRSYFLPYYVASSIVDKVEYTSLNKMERSLKGIMIKETCLPLNVNRLGTIEISEHDNKDDMLQ